MLKIVQAMALGVVLVWTAPGHAVTVTSGTYHLEGAELNSLTHLNLTAELFLNSQVPPLLDPDIPSAVTVGARVNSSWTLTQAWSNVPGSGGCHGCVWITPFTVVGPELTIPGMVPWAINVAISFIVKVGPLTGEPSAWVEIYGLPSGVSLVADTPLATPLPPALLLFGSVLGIGGLLGWRRTRQA